MAKSIEIKKEYQHGRGTFTNLYVKGIHVAEKHDGQMTTNALNGDQIRLLRSLNDAFIHDESARFDWHLANRLYLESAA